MLVPQSAPAVRGVAEITPVRIFKTPDGTTIADMGQNMTGWVRLRVSGLAGTTVTLRHAEVLDAAGNFYTDNRRAAAQTVQYTLRGQSEEIYEPHFTFQGFRHVAVEGYPGNLKPESLTGIVIHSDVTPTSEFETSSDPINQLQHNILWSQKGNFVDVPTDCPQRDERLGWTGDAEVFSATAAFNMDVEGFFTKWLADLAADQDSHGAVSNVVPDVLTGILPDTRQIALATVDWMPIYNGDIRRCVPLSVNCALVSYARVLGLIANQLGQSGEAQAFTQEANARTSLMHKYCWNEQKGVFLEYDYVAGDQLPYVSECAYWTLWSGVASRQQADRLVKNLRLLEQSHGLASTDRAYADPHSEASYMLKNAPYVQLQDLPPQPDAPPQFMGGRAPMMWMYPAGWATTQLYNRCFAAGARAGNRRWCSSVEAAANGAKKATFRPPFTRLRRFGLRAS
jgi:hypothetical protein